MTEWLAGFGAVVFGAIALYFLMDARAVRRAFRRSERRRKEMQAVAERMGLSYDACGDFSRWVPLDRFGLLRREGHDRAFENILIGDVNGREVAVFDYRYTPGSALDVFYPPTVFVTAVAIPTGRDIVDCELSPETAADRLREVFGAPDIDFGDDPDFSRAYVLRGRSEDAVRRVFDARVRLWFAKNRGWFVQSASGWLLCFKSDRTDARVPADAIERYACDAVRIARLIEGVPETG